MGLHTDSRRTLQAWLYRFADEHPAYPRNARDRAGTRAVEAHALIEVPEGALGRPRSRGFLFDRSLDEEGADSLHGLLRDRSVG